MQSDIAQGKLFAAESIRPDIPPDIVPAKQPPLAASADPVTSFEAADAMDKSGKLGRHRRIMLETLRDNPGHTAKELAHLPGWNVMRRAAGLPT